MKRSDGSLGCWLPAWIVEAKLFWRVLACLLIVSTSHIVKKRVRQEEEMLRSVFGEEWEAWHARTKRFIPGII